MQQSWMVLPATALALALAACNSDSVPTGQVAATVDGKEITTLEVTTEANGTSSTDPDQQKLISNLALDAIVSRTIVEKEAISRGIDKTPTGTITLNRARQLALLELLKTDLAKNPPKISDQEAQRFIADNPSMFANRTIAIVDQLAIPTLTQELVKEMEPINTLAGIKQLLNSKKIPYRASIGTVDSMGLTGDAGRQITGMSVGDVYIIPQASGARVNAIRSRESYPISMADALPMAKDMLVAQRLNEQVNTALAKIVTDGRANVKYAENFALPQAPKAAPAAGAANAPAAAE